MAVVWFVLLVAVICGLVGAVVDGLWWLLAIGVVLAVVALVYAWARFRHRAGRPVR